MSMIDADAIRCWCQYRCQCRCCTHSLAIPDQLLCISTSLYYNC